MGKLKFVLALGSLALFLLAIYFVLKNEKAVVMHPEGMIARRELSLILTYFLLMFVIIIPTLLFLFWTVWKYRSDNKKAEYDPEHYARGAYHEIIWWILPSIIVAVMVVITWYGTHELDPYRPIKSDEKPLKIQVIAIDWKWLFIYPEQGIATVNVVHFPAKVPIHFELAADNSPMNSFWIPQLSGQIYAMTGMVTPLHIMADKPGEYSGKAAEINGSGYAHMRFVARAVTEEDFEKWVQHIKQSALPLTDQVYSELVKSSENHPPAYYSYVEKGFFKKIVMKYMPGAS